MDTATDAPASASLPGNRTTRAVKRGASSNSELQGSPKIKKEPSKASLRKENTDVYAALLSAEEARVKKEVAQRQFEENQCAQQQIEEQQCAQQQVEEQQRGRQYVESHLEKGIRAEERRANRKSELQGNPGITKRPRKDSHKRNINRHAALLSAGRTPEKEQCDQRKIEEKQRGQTIARFLWSGGRENLHATDLYHVKIVPMQLRTMPDPRDNSITLSAVLRSPHSGPTVLLRTFDRKSVEATALEIPGWPSTPNSDHNKVLDDMTETYRTSTMAMEPNIDPCMRRDPTPNGTLMHLQYARCFVPLIAAIILQDKVQVCSGDTIELPLPHPKAWLETVAWVYTGRKPHMKAQVRDNVWYLGGRVR